MASAENGHSGKPTRPPRGTFATLALPYGEWRIDITDERPNELLLRRVAIGDTEGARRVYLVDGGDA
jgi:hypothetical protein